MCFFYRQHLRALSRYQALRLGLLLQDCTRALYQTTRRRPGGEKQSPTSPMPTAAASPRTLHKVTRSSYSVERAMEVLLKDGTGARMLSNCTATFFFSTTWLYGGAHATKLYGDFFPFRLQDCAGATHYQTARRRRWAGSTNQMTAAGAAFFPIRKPIF